MRTEHQQAHIFWVFLIALMIQVPLMVLAGLQNPDQINPDAIAYLRVAQNYLHGNLHLAVNGYWGPLFSWLVVPVLSLVNDPVFAFRIVDWITCMIYLIGGISVLHALGFDRSTVTIGAILMALFSIQWSIFFIGPDLLMSGLLLVALSYTLASDDAGIGRSPLVSGLFYGAAYLTKAVALPIALLSLICIATIRVLAGITSFRSALYMVGRSVLGLALLVIPWVLVLSLHYGKPTFSTSAPLNHALVGPHNPNWYHPSSAVYNVPQPGRITTWEDPTVFRNHPLYTPWSPFSSWGNFKHQIKVMFGNSRLQFHYFREFDGFGFGIISAILGFLFFWPWFRSFQSHPWRFGTIVIALITAIYLPVYSAAPRYFVSCYPFLFAATFGVLTVLVKPIRFRHFGLIVTTLLLGYGLTEPLKRSFTTRGYGEAPYSVARQMASSLQFHGPVAAVGDGRRVALYVAFLTGQPYYGIKREVNGSVGELRKMGAAFVVVKPGISMDKALSKDPTVQLIGLHNGSRERIYRIRVPLNTNN